MPFLKEGHEVTVYDDLSSGKKEILVHCMDEIDFLQRDLVSDKDLTQVLKDKDHVYHVAANPDVRVGADNTWVSVEQNILATYNLLEAIRKVKTRRSSFPFIHIHIHCIWKCKCSSNPRGLWSSHAHFPIWGIQTSCGGPYLSIFR